MNTKVLFAIITLNAVLIITACQTPPPVFIEPLQPAAAESPAENFIESAKTDITAESREKPPVPIAPQVDMATMKIGNINSSRAEIVVTINVENPNVFEIPPPTITYDYHLNRNSFIRGIAEPISSPLAKAM